MNLKQKSKLKLNILESSWEENAEQLRITHPLKTLRTLPKMAGVTPQTARFLKGKGLWYLLSHDKDNVFLRYFFKRPIRYALSLLRSYQKKESFLTQAGQEDFFFYGITGEQDFLSLAFQENTLILLGFSYCHKPFECPSGRFSDACQNDPSHPVCGQCFIGKCSLLASHTTISQILYIPTIHFIGQKIFQAVQQNPHKQVLFLITACELSLKMFGDWGNMVQAKGIGIRLGGRICNTMQAFKLSEEGIKPGLTVVTDKAQQSLLHLIKSLPVRSDGPFEKA